MGFFSIPRAGEVNPASSTSRPQQTAATTESTDSKDAGRPAPGSRPSPGGAAFMDRAAASAEKSKRFKGANVLDMNPDYSSELRDVSPDGKVTKGGYTAPAKLAERLDGHRGRVIIRNPDGTTKYMFERLDANGNPDPQNGTWHGFNASGEPAQFASPSEAIRAENAGHMALTFRAYYMNSQTGEPFELPPKDKHGGHYEDVGIDLPRYEDRDLHRLLEKGDGPQSSTPRYA